MLMHLSDPRKKVHIDTSLTSLAGRPDSTMKDWVLTRFLEDTSTHSGFSRLFINGICITAGHAPDGGLGYGNSPSILKDRSLPLSFS
ncbi:unnamed protein product [Gadus morhua 'NCC']